MPNSYSKQLSLIGSVVFSSPLYVSVFLMRFGADLIVIVLDALMLAEGVLGWVSNTSLFYEGVNPSFKFVVGFIAVVLAASLMEKEK